MKAADKLRVTWGREPGDRKKDCLIHYPMGYSTNTDAHYLSGIFNKAFTDELTARGYDVSTLKFEISPKKGNPKFRSQRPEEGGD